VKKVVLHIAQPFAALAIIVGVALVTAGSWVLRR
jgi:hypothetical protein